LQEAGRAVRQQAILPMPPFIARSMVDHDAAIAE
jgi:hypothetical protein